jgi:LPXTG-motif cell wall-anchored protein
MTTQSDFVIVYTFEVPLWASISLAGLALAGTVFVFWFRRRKNDGGKSH